MSEPKKRGLSVCTKKAVGLSSSRRPAAVRKDTAPPSPVSDNKKRKPAASVTLPRKKLFSQSTQQPSSQVSPPKQTQAETPTRVLDYSLPLTERYRPQSSEELIGNQRAVNELRHWIKVKKTQLDIPLVALLYGPPGVGKTTAAHVLLKEAGYRVTEINASEARQGKELIQLIQRRNDFCVGGDTVASAVIVDEVDGLYEPDKETKMPHTIDLLIKWIEKDARRTQPPVVFICNERYTKSMRKLARVAYSIAFYRLRPADLTVLMNSVTHHDKTVKVSYQDRHAVVAAANGDARVMLNNLHVQSFQSRLDSKPTNMFECCQTMFSSSTPRMDVYESNELNHLMLHENYLAHDDLSLEQICMFADTLSATDLTPRLRDDIMPHAPAALGRKSTRTPKYSFPTLLTVLKEARDKKAVKKMTSLDKHPENYDFVQSLLRSWQAHPSWSKADVDAVLQQLQLFRLEEHTQAIPTLFQYIGEKAGQKAAVDDFLRKKVVPVLQSLRHRGSNLRALLLDWQAKGDSTEALPAVKAVVEQGLTTEDALLQYFGEDTELTANFLQLVTAAVQRYIKDHKTDSTTIETEARAVMQLLQEEEAAATTEEAMPFSCLPAPQQ